MNPTNKLAERLQFRITKMQIDDQDKRYLQIAFPTPEGVGEISIPRGLLTKTSEAKATFATAGAVLPDDFRETCARLLEAKAPAVERLTVEAGWHGDQYVTPWATYSKRVADTKVVFNPSASLLERSDQTWSFSGSLTSFIEEARPFLEASPYLTFAYGLALTAPLAARIGRTEGFTVAFTQKSGSGKTLCIRLAHSLGNRGREKDLANFGDTQGVVLQNLATYGGRCLAFGDPKSDLSEKETAEKLNTLIFNGASGKTRKRLNQQAIAKNPQFLIPMVTAEDPIVKLFEKQGVSYEGGETARLIELHPPKNVDGGIFVGRQDSAQLAIQFDRFLERNHGMVLGPWAELLSALDAASWAKRVERYEAAFLKEIESLHPDYVRIGKHFALIEASGLIAGKTKGLPVSTEHYQQVIRDMFWRYVTSLQRKHAEARQQWSDFFDLVEDETDVPLLTVGKEPRTEPEKGFRRNENGVSIIYVTREAIVPLFGSEAVANSLAIPLLIQHGCLIRTPKGDLTAPVKQAGLKRRRYYRLSAAKLQEAKAQILD